ncbi:MAG: MFS transporter [Oscillospiraceae bacterium]|nr:MFS transporter [Oscillospiraceae bacterium]
MKAENKGLFRAAILTMSLVQMGANGIAPILAQIGETFSAASPARIQFLMTFPTIFSLIFTMITAFVSDVIPKKKLVVAGLTVVGLGGVLAFCFHGSLAILFLWAAVIGIGIGMVAPVAPALINENFSGGDKQMMLGLQNSSSTAGGMLMSFIGGSLALAGWPIGYLIYLICIPGLILAVIGLPRDIGTTSGKTEETTRGRFRLVIWKEMLITILLLTAFSSIPANISMLVEERSLGDTSVSGTVSTVFLLGGLVGGLLYGKIAPRLKRFTSTLGALLLAAGALVLALAGNVALVLIGCFFAGFATMVMPANLAAAGRLPGYETLNSALILSSSFIGAFITPVLTGIALALSGSPSVTYRFYTTVAAALILAVLTVLFGEKDS